MTPDTWRIVGFQHPWLQKSLVYRQNLTTEQLIKVLKDGIEKNCNLFSIRGFTVNKPTKVRVKPGTLAELEKVEQ